MPCVLSSSWAAAAKGLKLLPPLRTGELAEAVKMFEPKASAPSLTLEEEEEETEKELAGAEDVD